MKIHKSATKTEENQTVALSRISMKMVKFYYMSDFRFKNGKVSIISIFRQCEKVTKTRHVDHRLRWKKTFPRKEEGARFPMRSLGWSSNGEHKRYDVMKVVPCYILRVEEKRRLFKEM